jgi:hypothetical protein
MDSVRMTRLFSNNDKLSEKLLFELNNYKFYTQCTVPNIAVLCSEESLKNQILNSYDKTRSDYIIDTFSTAQGNEGLLENIMNRDALIIYTNALKIAPKPLYDICSDLSVAAKKIFVLLGGWNQMPREAALIKRRLAQVAKEFPKNDLVMVKGVYEDGSAEGLDSLANAFETVLNSIKNNFSQYRYKQEEALYSLHKKAVNLEISQLQKSIVATNAKVVGYLDFIHKKQSGYQVVFKGVNIGLTDVVGELKCKLDSLTVSELVDYLKENCEDKDFNNVNSIVEKLKEKLIEKVTQFVEAINHSPKTDVSIQIDSFIQECKDEMQYVVSELGRLNYVSSAMLKDFELLTQEVSSLTSLQHKVKVEFNDSMESAAAKIKGLINSIEVNTRKFTYLETARKAVDGFETAKEFIDNITAENQNENNTKEEEEDDEIVEAPDTVKKFTGFETKIEDAKSNAIDEIVKELLDSAKVSVLAQMDSILQAAKNSVQMQSKYYVDLYFQKIVAELNKISDDLTAQKKMLSPID